MAFPDGWTRKCALTIEADLVDADLTDFPVLFTIANLPSEMLDADGSNPALNGGGDIRFSSDSAGATQLPCEVVTFATNNNPAAAVAQIYVKVPTVSGSADTTIYVWYGKSGESQPAATDTYGRNAVWSAFTAVYHLEENPGGSAPQGINSQGSSLDLTTSGSMTSGDEVAAKVENGWDFDGVNDFGESTDVSNFIANNNGHMEAWVYLRDIVTANAASYNGEGIVAEESGYCGLYYCQISTTHYIAAFNWDGSEDRVLSASPATNTWIHVAWKHSGGVLELFKNGVSIGTTASGNTQVVTGNLRIGRGFSSSGKLLDGIVDEVRTSNSAKSTAWIAATYNSTNSPGTFVVAGTPESTSNDVTMSADPGSYAITGTNASLEQGYEVPADAGSFSITGTDASLEQGYKVQADSGAYIITGNDASLEQGFEIAVDPGSYSLSGTDANLFQGYEVQGDAGEYTITGQDATLLETEILTCDVGNYSLSGTDAALEQGYEVATDPGSYAIVGQDASLLQGYEVQTDAGSYAITGTDASLLEAKRIAVDAGVYAIAGTDANLEQGFVLTCDVGVYSLSGQDVSFAINTTLEADAGSYTLTGTAAAFEWDHRLSAEVGSYIITGIDVTLTAAEVAILGGKFVAGQVWHPGFQNAQLAFAGMHAGEVIHLGVRVGEVFVPGFQEGGVIHPGFQAGQVSN